MPDSIKKLVKGNEDWVRTTVKFKPDLFDKLSRGQNPNFLWIGCSDSRVPASEITNQLPGSMFVHRNIANMVLSTDLNLLSVVYYAVFELKVKHIILCGRYGCGGIRAAMNNQPYGFLDNWLYSIQDVYRFHKAELDAIEDIHAKEDRFVELNVREQVLNLAKISFIQEAWNKSEFPFIHGWVYQMDNGLLKDLDYTIHSNETLEPLYKLHCDRQID